ncbi:aminotransferase class I/II-fold pyridoxal phosphate-dependent enzyme [Paenibacillus sp. y28]|uniref:aminotransferase class I/II-fold pyridoxal phosphate-dependent enzyme n=1 Tax=Paenibacillus sp. y28 TaxID=3129110 RepID=UPI00301B6C3F
MNRSNNIQQQRAPLYEALVSHYNRDALSLHVPGHKSGQGLDPQAKAFLGGVMSLDQTEISGLDDLHDPQGAILEAQELAAACFGADETRFLVGGSTAGNLAMILSVCRQGENDIVIVQRNSHKSVWHGLMLAGARAVFLPARMDPDSGLAAAARPDDVRDALEAYPSAKAVLLTSPNYYGMGANLAAIADLAHQAGIPLLVDEAHGAHYGFHPDLPASALQCGADAVVQSTHKLLTAMTMGAMLHVQGPRMNKALLYQRLAMLQSSSPSYPIMSSLDLARRQMALEGESRVEAGLQAVRLFREKLQDDPVFRILPRPGELSAAYETLDPFKVLVEERTGALNGGRLQRQLEGKGCYPELATERYVLLVFSPASTAGDALRIAKALQEIAEECLADGSIARTPIVFKETGVSAAESQPEECTRAAGSNWAQEPAIDAAPIGSTGDTGISLPVAFGLDDHSVLSGKESTVSVESVPWLEAAGRAAAEMVIPYPPGIPVVFAGETITATAAEALWKLAEGGVRFQGLHDSSGATVRVKI